MVTRFIDDFCRSAFALMVLAAVAIAGVVTLMFVAGLVIGGATATALAVNGNLMLGWAVKVSSAAVFVGLVVFYVSGQHELTLTDQGHAEDDGGAAV